MKTNIYVESLTKDDGICKVLEYQFFSLAVQYKSVIAWDLGLEQIHPISDFVL